MSTDIENTNIAWPALPPFAEWEDTFNTVHMWTQIVGKFRLELSPEINHSWGCALYVTARGLTTSPIPYQGRTFSIDFDFVAHALQIDSSDGGKAAFVLEPMTVAEFYQKTMQSLSTLGIAVKIYERPVEVVVAIPFPDDQTHASYDADAVHLFWRALAMADQVFKTFRARSSSARQAPSTSSGARSTSRLPAFPDAERRRIPAARPIARIA